MPHYESPADLKAAIKTKWLAGDSAGAIGKALGITKNSAIGHVRRMKLPKRSQDAHRQEGAVGGKKPSKAPAQPKRVKSPPAATPEALEPVLDATGKAYTLETIPNRACRYPIGGIGLEMTFCGHGQDANSPYCSFHKARCTTPKTGKSTIDPKVVRASGINRAFS